MNKDEDSEGGVVRGADAAYEQHHVIWFRG